MLKKATETFYIPYEGHYEEENYPVDEPDDLGHDPARLIDAEVILPHQGDSLQAATVIGRSDVS